MTRFGRAVAIVAVLVCSPVTARADVVLDWNAIAVTTLTSQPSPGVNPFAQARFMSIVQLAVFEAVNAVTEKYEPYLGTVVAPAGASADAAAVAAAYNVLKNYFPGSAPTLDRAYAASLRTIPHGTRRDRRAKTDGIATGEAAAAQMIALRVGDGSAPAEISDPASPAPGVWQTTAPGCTAGGGAFFQWKKITPFGIPSDPSDREAWIEHFRPGPPPALTSNRYAKDYNEVKKVGNVTSDSTERSPARADMARFYHASSPSLLFNLAARQVAVAQGRSLSHNARALALINMATNDSLVASFGTKYFYNFWRPETAIRAGNTDGNSKTKRDLTFAPYIATPCFPSYPSNHASGSTGAAAMLSLLYGNGRHPVVLTNPTAADPTVRHLTFRYSRFTQITDDIDDARVYGGIHFRFDQDAGGRLGRDIASYIYRNNLRRAKYSWDWNENDGENEGENESDNN